MPSVAKDIAAGLLAVLEAATFSQPVYVTRKYVPQMDIKAIDGVQVTVVPRGDEMANADRSRLSHTVTVDVAVQAKVSGTTPTEVDPLMDLVQEVADFLTRRPLPSVPSAAWLRIVNVPVYAPDHLSLKATFTSVLTVTYMVLR